MKYLSAAVLIFFASVACAATFTAVQSGDWNAPSTWGLSGSATCHTNIPCKTDAGNSGDTILIPDKYTITCGANGDETCSVGNSPASATTNVLAFTSSTGGGGIHVCGKTSTAGCAGGTNGSVLIYAGSIGWSASGSSQGTFIFDPGSTLQYDSSWASTPSSVAYVVSTKSTAGATSNAMWAINGISTSHITFQGDSFYSSQRKSSACTSAGSCLGGTVGNNGGSYNESGCGTVTYLDMSNFQGGWNSNIYQLCSTSISYSTFTNTGVMTTTAVPSGNKNWSLANVNFSKCRAACLTFTGQSTATGTFSLTNAAFDSSVSYGSITYPRWNVQNVFISSGALNGAGGLNPGFQNVGAWIADQIFIYHNGVTTNPTTDAGQLSNVPVEATSNSVFWRENFLQAAGLHNHSWQHVMTDVSSSTAKFINNVYGAMGGSLFNPNNGGDTFTSTAWQQLPASATTYQFTGNVALCGANGLASHSLFHMTNIAATAGTISVTAENNTSCSSAYSVAGNLDENGAITAEAMSGTYTNYFNSIDSNLFYQVTGGHPIIEISGPQNLTHIIGTLANNAVVNTNTGAAAICSGCTNWAANAGPVNDITIQSRPPVLVEANRSVPLFDTEYLIPAGILPANYYTSDPQWQGAWSGSHGTYNIGDVVSDAQSTVFGGKAIYWRCIQSHTASSTLNRPVTGFNSSQPFYGYQAYWELAYLKYARTAVVAGTTYVDGALPALVETTGAAVPMYFNGLLNAWLRQGMTSMEPTLWNGCLNGKECGAIQFTAIQHIPPPSAVN